MTVLMLIGAICFCVFLAFSVENMLAFQVSKKREWLFEGVAACFIAAVTFLGLFFQLSLPLFFLLIGVFAAILFIVKYKSLKKGLAFLVYLTTFTFGVLAVVILLARLRGHELIGAYEFDTLPEGSVIWYTLLAMALAFLPPLLKKPLGKRIDMNMLNSQTMRFLLVSAGIILLFIYLNFAAPAASITLGRWQLDFGEIAYLLFFIASVGMFVLILRYISRESKLKTEQLLIEASQTYIHDLEESHKALRALKHDYVNILSSFKLYIDSDDMAGLRRYYYDELAEMNRELLHQDQLLGSLQNVRISEIKSVLIFKAARGAEQKAAIVIEAKEPVETLGVSTAIVCQMLGILLDNAIEGALETEAKKLRIAIVKNPGSAVFIIQNTWKKRDIPVDKLFELGFSTKAQGRGLGLHTARGYTEKIKGLYLETELTDQYFTQTLTVREA